MIGLTNFFTSEIVGGSIGRRIKSVSQNMKSKSRMFVGEASSCGRSQWKKPVGGTNAVGIWRLSSGSPYLNMQWSWWSLLLREYVYPMCFRYSSRFPPCQSLGIPDYPNTSEPGKICQRIQPSGQGLDLGAGFIYDLQTGYLENL